MGNTFTASTAPQSDAQGKSSPQVAKTSPPVAKRKKTTPQRSMERFRKRANINFVDMAPLQLSRTRAGKKAAATVKASKALRASQTPDGSEEDLLVNETASDVRTQMHVYDILDKRLNTKACMKRNVCVISPEEQLYVFKAFEKNGYFNIPHPMDAPQLQSYLDANPIPGRPVPHVVSMPEYEAGMQICGRFLHNLSRGGNVVFVNLRDVGGLSAGPWWCKGNVYTHLLYLKKHIKGVAGKYLVFAHHRANLTDLYKALAPLHAFDGTEPVTFVYLADGVYSGLEAADYIAWWTSQKQKAGKEQGPIKDAIARMRLCIVTPVTGDARLFANRREEKYPMQAIADTKKNPVWERPTLFYAMHWPQSFVLPFKIADHASLQGYDKIVKNANPEFISPYKKNPMCQDLDTSNKKLIKKRRLSIPPP